MRGKSLELIFVYIFLLLSINAAFVLSIGIEDANIKCIERERHALLKFKQGLIDQQGHLSSWGNQEHKKDCCKWRGVHCNYRTGHVIGLNLTVADYFDTPYMPLRGNISSSLLEIQHLNYLDMRYNYFEGKSIPQFMGSLKKLRHLDLSNAGFGGRVPYQLGNLSNLQYLDLSYNFGDMYADKLEWLSHLTLLKYISLNQVNLTEATDWLQAVSQLSFLTELHLQGCNLQSVAFSSSVAFVNSSHSLSLLNLAENDLTDSIYFWFSNFSGSLVGLGLSYNKLQGPIPELAFRKMTSLISLDLTDNRIESIPKSFRNLCRLKALSLERNNLTGQLLDLLLNLSGCTRNTVEVLSLDKNMLFGSLPDITLFPSLRALYISDNRLNGSFPENFQKISNLTTLYLGSNQLRGSLPDFSVFLSLEYLDVSNNRLNGTLTKSIGKLSKLEDLDLFLNSLEDTITEVHMSNLSSLKFIDLSYNSLSFNFSSSWVPPFQLKNIKLRGCKLGPNFPEWPQTQNNFVVIDMSNAGISGSVPNWFWDQSPLLNYLNLSHNHISGVLPDLSMKFSGYPGIDLSSNLFEGSIPPVPPNMSSLILSRNMFSGSVSFLCEITSEYFSYLDLSDNKLSGEIPDCSIYWKKFIILNLGNNNLSGKIPNSIGSSCILQSLHLRNNSLEGDLPLSLKNCTELTVIDLGNNKFSGTIPTWIGDTLSNLAILSLRSNQFYGSMPVQLCNLRKVQVLDLSQNSISGIIPECLNNLTTMAQKESSNAIITYSVPFSITINMTGDDADYQDHALLVWKGIDSEYKNTLGLVKSIDLSGNKLLGEIPEEITSLIGLISLNLSSNRLIGSIPQKIGQLILLNSLDLSRNELTGEIPESFSQLNHLGVLKLSSNKLSGKIPSSTKLQSFDASAYLGNPELCGSPLSNTCPGEEPAQVPAITAHVDSKNGFITRGFYVSISLGYIIGLWGFCGTFLLNRSWRYGYLRFLNDIMDKIYILIAVNMTKLQRQHRS